MVLIHHDGQHGMYMTFDVSYAHPHFQIFNQSPLGLIRWKLVIHGFVDGFSRYVLGMRISNNNRRTAQQQFYRFLKILLNLLAIPVA